MDSFTQWWDGKQFTSKPWWDELPLMSDEDFENAIRSMREWRELYQIKR